ncbi:UNVERIFIED_CONTAM: PD-(D/E)XK nuclease superfamily protein [Acetivibrio alkalicellulosi]
MRKFNIAGVCIPDKHYMVDISNTISKAEHLIDDGEYFTINRARQYGKTTTMFMVQKKIQHRYDVIATSFEGLGSDIFKEERNFSGTVLEVFAKDIRFTNKKLSDKINKMNKNITTIEKLSSVITDICYENDKKIVLMIDEVDKSSDNQTFLHFLGMLRNKFLNRNMERDYTFHSVILAGVYDVKNLKLKLAQDEEKKYNSPWNIAVDFKANMSFNPKEISSMLEEYEKDYKTGMDIQLLSKELYYYTSGYPFLVSKLCKLIDEDLGKNWTVQGIQESVKLILKQKNTLFDDVMKNLENNKELYDSIYAQLILGHEYTFNIDNPIDQLGYMYGIFREQDNTRIIHNKIFEQRIYEYMAAKLEQRENLTPYSYKNNFIDLNGDLDVKVLLDKFQQMMKEEYSNKDKEFLEREGRLLFMAFLRPVINGVGFALKEVQISQEQRLDIVITYNNKKYVVELKKWYGEKYHQKGLDQLDKYLDNQGLKEGYLIIFNFNQNKEYINKYEGINNKQIYQVIV